MDVRSYDPALARWTTIDPVTHHGLSPYNAFDNNPIYWSDPSGADSEPVDWQKLFDNAKPGMTTFDGNGNKTGYMSPEEIENNDGGTDPENGFTSALALQDALHGNSSGINPNFANGGLMSAYNGGVRTWYAIASYNLKYLYYSTNKSNWQLGMDSRYTYKVMARRLSSPVWRRLLNLKYPVSRLIVPEGAVKSPTRFFKTNLGWNTAGGLSLTAGIFGLGISG